MWARGIRQPAVAGMPAGQAPHRGGSQAQRRSIVLWGAIASFIAIFVLRQLATGSGDSLGDAFGLLYVLPIALIGLEMGLLAGMTAAVAVIVVDVAWMQANGRDLDGAALFIRSGIFVFAAGLTGTFSERMQGRLREQEANAGRLIAEQESERREIATQLHEEAAQTLAAALLTVGMLERRAAASNVDAPQLEVVREHVKGCIADLRRIAAPLRPDVLDEMGLATAVRRLAEREAEHGRHVSIATERLPADLPRELQGLVYRLIESLVRALSGARSIDGSLEGRRSSLALSLSAALPGDPPGGASLDAALASARARVQLSGGTLRIEPHADGVRIVALLALER